MKSSSRARISSGHRFRAREARPATDRDRLAASRLGNQKHAHVPGVDFEDLDAARAFPACEAALARWPQETRFAFQYGRALEKAGNEAEALRWYRKAADQGDALAQTNLARLGRAG